MKRGGGRKKNNGKLYQ